MVNAGKVRKERTSEGTIENSAELEHAYAAQFFGLWTKQKQKLSGREIHRINDSFGRNVLGYTDEQVRKSAMAESKAFDAVAMANPGATTIDIVGKNREIYDKTIAAEIGPVKHRNDFRAFWKEVLPLLPVVLSSDNLELLVKDGLRSAQWLVLALTTYSEADLQRK